MLLLPRIETYLARTAMPPSRFSREAANDPRFVFDLRNGRRPRGRTAARIHAWLDGREGGKSC